MTEAGSIAFLILLIGVVVILAMLIKALLEKTPIPPLVGYLLLGVGVSLLHDQTNLVPARSMEIFEFLGKIGLVTLLFKIGLDSELKGLLQQLRKASGAWATNILLTGLIGYVTSYYLLDLSNLTSLFIATAFTATSVGITVAIWEDAGMLHSDNGSLLVDLAELDDVTAIVLMALLFAVAPHFVDGPKGDVWVIVAQTMGVLVLKLISFAVFCFLFAMFLERPLSRKIQHIEKPPDPTLTAAGTGFVIAALAGLLGFSLAIGAFFAGLVFSRDPKAIRLSRSFLPLYDLFAPFFFVAIGIDLNPEYIASALGVGLILSLAAIGSKFIANALPVALFKDRVSGILIGVSMIPRAEISLIVMQQGVELGGGIIPESIYGGMIVVTAATAVVAPVLTRYFLRKWPQQNGPLSI